MSAVAQAPQRAATDAADSPARTAPAGGWLRERGMGATVLVAGISTAFGVLLLSASGFISAWVGSDPYLGGGETLTLILGILSVLLVGVAVTVVGGAT